MAAETVSSNIPYGGASEPCAIVLFGASGDLAKRKVIPALFDLAAHAPSISAIRRARPATSRT